MATTLLMTLSSAAESQIAIEPGLWEMTMQMQSSSGEVEKILAQIQQQIADMSPEQRAEMKNALAEQGTDIPTADGAQTFRMCVTPQMASEFEMPLEHTEGCESRFNNKNDNVIDVSYECAMPPSEGKGTIKVESRRAYSAQMEINTRQGKQNEKMTIEYKGTWLNENCGNLKPPVAQIQAVP